MFGPSARAELAAGWRVLVASAFGVGLSAISLPFYALGPLAKPIEAATGWAREDIFVAIIFSSGIGALTAPVTGWMVDRFGPRAVALPSIAGVSLGLLIAAQAQSLAQFYLGFAATAVLGAGTNPVLWSRVIAGRFDAARGTALGLALVGTALTSILLPLLIAALVPAVGWRGAMMGLALLPLLVSLPIGAAWLWPGDRGDAAGGPERPLWGLTLPQALRSYRFWVLGASVLAAYLAISGLLANLVPTLSDRGIGAARAASLAASVGVAMIPGRILVGLLVDRFWAPAVGLVVIGLPVLSCAILASSDSALLLLVACMLLGLAAGAELDLLAFLTSRYFGLAHFAKIYALLYTALAAGSAFAPTLFARAVSAGGLDAALGLTALLFAAGALLMPLLGRYPIAEPLCPPGPVYEGQGR
jgi:OFA family oxalate/formate antiporter-like MFS transporter